MTTNSMTGRVSYYTGVCAEDRIAADYVRRGHRIVGRRWRGQSGEIDLIAQGRGGLVFIEVKASKKVEQVKETHRMRYLFLPELLRFADAEVWTNFKSFGWMKLQELHQEDWAGLFLATKK